MSTRESYESWLRDYLRKRYPELEAPLLAAADAFDAIQKDRRVTPELLAPIVEGACSPRQPLHETATSLLGALAADHEEAREAIARMAADADSQVRFNAIISLQKSAPRPFAIQWIRQALRDKSAEVRKKAAHWAQHLELHEVVPDLAQAVATEKSAKTKQHLESYLRLIRDGYILEDAGVDGYRVTVTIRDGLQITNVPREAVDRHGIQAVAEKLRASPGFKPVRWDLDRMRL